MKSKQFSVPFGDWGNISGQIFGEESKDKKVLLLVHGYLDNSNSFKPLAPFLTDTQNYLIAIDLPGMGLSSKIPDRIPYSLKIFVSSIHYVVKHFKLESFSFLTHSLGCSIALAYTACYQEKVDGLYFIDFALKECDINLKENIGEIWREGIEKIDDYEHLIEEKKLRNKIEKELTYDFALKRLLESNEHIDELAAIVLLERGLTININEKLVYSRDIRLVTTISLREYHYDFITIFNSLVENFNIPVVFIYATPPPFGEKLFSDIQQMVAHLKKHSHSTVDFIPIDGTHHFHMLKNINMDRIIISINQDHEK